MAKQVIDPWLVNADGTPDPFAGTVDFGMTSQDEIDDPDAVLEIHPGLNPQIINQPVAPSEPEPVAVAPVVVEPDPDEPEVTELEDGGTITLEKAKGQWKATLDPGGTANPEVFWGKSKNALVSTVLKAKLNATKKIRDLNKKIKLGSIPAQPVQVQQPSAYEPKQLTGDEVFEIQTQLQSNPDLALETWFQKKTGVPMAQLVEWARKGAEAEANLRTEAVARAFVSRNPDYYPDPDNVNSVRLIQWIGKYKLGNPGANIYDLDSSGQWTVENLEEAFADLSSDDLMVKAPRAPRTPRQTEPTPPVAVHQEPAQSQRPDERIVRTETRPRAALGIRNTDVTPTAPPATQNAPSVDDLERMSDEEIHRLYGAIRRQSAQARRS